MTQTSNRLLDEFARLVTDAAGAAQGVRREAETVIKAQMERLLAEMEVARREEVDVLRDMVTAGRAAAPRCGTARDIHHNSAMRAADQPGALWTGQTGALWAGLESWTFSRLCNAGIPGVIVKTRLIRGRGNDFISTRTSGHRPNTPARPSGVAGSLLRSIYSDLGSSSPTDRHDPASL